MGLKLEENMYGWVEFFIFGPHTPVTFLFKSRILTYHTLIHTTHTYLRTYRVSANEGGQFKNLSPPCGGNNRDGQQYMGGQQEERAIYGGTTRGKGNIWGDTPWRPHTCTTITKNNKYIMRNGA